MIASIPFHEKPSNIASTGVQLQGPSKMSRSSSSSSDERKPNAVDQGGEDGDQSSSSGRSSGNGRASGSAHIGLLLLPSSRAVPGKRGSHRAEEERPSSALMGMSSPTRSHFASAAKEADKPDSSAVDSAHGEHGAQLATFHILDSLGDVDILKYVKDHSTTLTFPEKLMLMLNFVERECSKAGKPVAKAATSWVPDGRAFTIRNKDYLVKILLPLFFGQAKFTSFTRKLYRWGFRKVTMMGQPSLQKQKNDDLFFGNENFQRDKRDLLVHMRSITAAKTQREIGLEGRAQHHAQDSRSSPETLPQLSTGLAANMPSVALDATSLTQLLAQQSIPALAAFFQSHLRQAQTRAQLEREIAGRLFNIHPSDATPWQNPLSSSFFAPHLIPPTVYPSAMQLSNPPFLPSALSQPELATQDRLSLQQASRLILQQQTRLSPEEEIVREILQRLLRQPPAPP